MRLTLTSAVHEPQKRISWSQASTASENRVLCEICSCLVLASTFPWSSSIVLPTDGVETAKI